MSHLRTVLCATSLVLSLSPSAPAVEQPCVENRYTWDGTLLSTVHADCDSGLRIAKRVFWRDGRLRSFHWRSPSARFREGRHRDGTLRSLLYREPGGLEVRISESESRMRGAEVPRGISTLRGLQFFSTGETLTFYGLAGEPERRLDRTGRELVIPPEAQPLARTDPFGAGFEAGYQKKVLDGRSAEGVFLGDSIVSQLNGLSDPAKKLVWDSLAGENSFMNAAIAGDRVTHLLARTWVIEPTARLVAVQIGTNNHHPFIVDADPRITAEAIARLIAEAQRIAPNATILLIAIPPTANPEAHVRNQLTNQLIETLADDERILFLEGGSEFDPADPEHSHDGLHQTYAGALAWYAPLVPVFREILEGD